MEEEKKLTAKQQRFVEEYLVDLNATAAAIRAGYSKKTAGSIGQENLTKPEIQAALKGAMNERANRTYITQDRVVKMMLELYECNSVRIPMLNFNGDQVVDDKGMPVWKMLDASSATKAVDMLARHTGAYNADNKREFSGGLRFEWGGKSDETDDD